MSDLLLLAAPVLSFIHRPFSCRLEQEEEDQEKTPASEEQEEEEEEASEEM